VIRALVYLYFSFWTSWLINVLVLWVVMATGGSPALTGAVWILATFGVMLGLVIANESNFGKPLARRKWLILSVLATVFGLISFLYAFSVAFQVIGL
jgi:hypothetical protein